MSESALTKLGQVRALIGDWVPHYNEARLHASLAYVPPTEYYRGDPAARLEERRVKLEQGRQARRQANKAPLTRAA